MLLITISLHAVSASLFLIPILLAVNAAYTRNVTATLRYYVFSLYICIVYDLVGPPNITYMNWDPAVNWVPLLSMVGDLRSTALNILMFIPLGAGLPLVCNKYRSFSKTVFFGFCFSTAIELSQLFTLRATDVNDLITNTLGAVIGYLLAKPFCSKVKTIKPMRPIVLIIISCLVMFFAEPFVFGLLYSLIFR